MLFADDVVLLVSLRPSMCTEVVHSQSESAT